MKTENNQHLWINSPALLFIRSDTSWCNCEEKCSTLQNSYFAQIFWREVLAQHSTALLWGASIFSVLGETYARFRNGTYYITQTRSQNYYSTKRKVNFFSTRLTFGSTVLECKIPSWQLSYREISVSWDGLFGLIFLAVLFPCARVLELPATALTCSLV